MASRFGVFTSGFPLNPAQSQRCWLDVIRMILGVRMSRASIERVETRVNVEVAEHKVALISWVPF